MKSTPLIRDYSHFEEQETFSISGNRDCLEMGTSWYNTTSYWYDRFEYLSTLSYQQRVTIPHDARV